MFLSIVKSARHNLLIFDGFILVPHSLHEWGPHLHWDHLGRLTNDTTTPGCHFGVPLVAMVFQGLIMEKCAISPFILIFYIYVDILLIRKCLKSYGYSTIRSLSHHSFFIAMPRHRPLECWELFLGKFPINIPYRLGQPSD